MTGATDAGSFRLLLADSAVVRTFGFALLGRLAYGVLPLCFLFTVRQASGSFTIATLSAAALGLATLAMPMQARWVDRRGQRRILPVYAGCFVALLVVGAVLAVTGVPAVAWPVLGVLLGTAAPALGPAMRAQWREIAAEGPQRRRAYSLDSVAEESVYLVGPVVSAAMLSAFPAWAGLLLAAALILAGTTALATSVHRPPASPRAGAVVTSPGGMVRSSVLVPLTPLLGCLFLFGAASAATFVSIAALADRHGDPGLAGYLEAALATGAVVGGLLWARIGINEPSAALPALLCHLALTATAAAVLTAHLIAFGSALAVGALATSAVYVAAFSAADTAVAPEQRTEASTWVTVATNAGTALGTAVAGLASRSGPSTALVLAAALACGAAVVALRPARGARSRRTG